MSTSDKPKLYGFYSELSLAAGNEPAVYRTPSGEQVFVHCVDESASNPAFYWSDKICVGEVVHYKNGGCVRGATPGSQYTLMRYGVNA